MLTTQETVQVHLTQTDRMRGVVALTDRRHRVDEGLVGDRGQTTDRGLDGPGEVRGIHRGGDVQRSQVAGDVIADLGVGQIVVERRRGRDLQDLGAQVRVGDASLNRVGAVHRVLEHDVRVTGLELDLGEGLEELTGVDLRLADPRVLDHLLVVLGDGHVGEGLAVDPLHVVRAEQVHVVVALGQLEGDVRDHHTQREGLDADLLVGVFPLGVQKTHDVGVVGVQVHRAGTLTGTELVGVGERVLQQLHHRDDTGGLVLDVLDRRADLTDIGQQQRHAATTLGQLQGGVDGASDGLHVVLDTQQETRDGFAALGLADVEEGRGGRLEPAVDDLVDQVGGQGSVAVGQAEGDHAHPVLVALQVAASVEGLQGVGRVVLERAEEGLEAELLGVGLLEQVLDELVVVLVEDGLVVVLVLDEIADLLLQVMEVDGVLVDVLEEVLVGGFPVLVELDVAVAVVEVQHRVERVVVQLFRLGHRLCDALSEIRGHAFPVPCLVCSCLPSFVTARSGTGHVTADSHVASARHAASNSARPSRTRATSSSLPINSNR